MAPDNSMAAIMAGLKSGASAVEVDVHCLKQKLILGHDHDDEGGADFDEALTTVMAFDKKAGIYFDGKKGAWAEPLAKKINTLPPSDRHRVMVGSFYFGELRRFKKLCPEALIFYSHKHTPGIHLILARVLGAYGVCYNYKINLGTSAWMRRRLGLKMAYYTVNDAEAARRCQKRGADFIFSDRPDIILKALGS